MSERSAWLDDRLVPWGEARVPLDDRGLQFAESLYEVIPVCGGRARLLHEHAARMRTGAGALALDSGIPEDGQWAAISAALVRDAGAGEGLLYAQVTGGSAPRRHLPDSRPKPTFFAYFLDFHFPRSTDVEAGIAAVTTRDQRWKRCDLKTTMLLAAVLAKREAVAQEAQEAFLVGDTNLVHEGASSNVFAVIGGTLTTPSQSPDLLPGTIRPLVVGLARELGLQVEARNLTLAETRSATELFVTSTTFLLMPVLNLDGRRVGDGRTGPVARELARRLRRKLGLDD